MCCTISKTDKTTKRHPRLVTPRGNEVTFYNFSICGPALIDDSINGFKPVFDSTANKYVVRQSQF